MKREEEARRRAAEPTGNDVTLNQSADSSGSRPLLDTSEHCDDDDDDSKLDTNEEIDVVTDDSADEEDRTRLTTSLVCPTGETTKSETTSKTDPSSSISQLPVSSDTQSNRRLSSP